MYFHLLILVFAFIFSSCGSSSEDKTIASSSCEGEELQRTRYQSPTAQSLEQCVQETQARTCSDNTLSEWSGSFKYLSCIAHPSSQGSLARWQMSQIEYAGGFRIQDGKVGSGTYSDFKYSPGVFTIDEDAGSIFTVTHEYEQGFTEIGLPELTLSEDPADFVQSNTLIQSSVPVYQTDRDVTGIDANFRVTGMYLLNNQLIVNYFNWYDGAGSERDTTMIFKDASDLNNSELIGPFQMGGATHAAGWITPIPLYWQESLGGTHISGMSQGSINGRLSLGPSAFIWTPEDELTSATQGSAIETIKALDYPLGHMLYDTEIFDANETDSYNKTFNNHLWTVTSTTGYGLIIPGTSTYMVIGHSSGHYSSIGYKITQDNGHLCGGPCSYEADDQYNFYWLYDVNDLISVVNGEMEAWDVRPYDYGEFDTIGNTHRIAAAHYNEDEDILYISLAGGDPLTTYGQPALFVAYHLNP
ncbi:hypothetical protein [Sulfurimonas sp.]|uniref:hypothetical protein n=1 Tax=Sulfurimonas sp. TaxID=2022749 RepID=UPI003D0F1E78